MYEFLGLLVLVAGVSVVVCFAINSWNTVVVDARKEDKRIFEQMVENEVERRVENILRNAEYHVHFKPVELINESDIDWGESRTKRRITMHKEAI